MNTIEGLLADVLDELRGLRADLRRQRRDVEVREIVVDAVRAVLGPGRFTLRGVIDLADDEPALREALAMLVDLAAPGAAIALQKRVKHWPEFEPVGEQRGTIVYRLRD